MTPSENWHAPTAVLERFAENPAAVDAATAASVETHLVACEACRAELTRLSDPELAVESWAAVADRIDRPRTSLLERALQRLGVRSSTARLVTATPGLRLSGLAAVGALTGLAVLASRHADATGPFLLIAPLVPLAAVALTFAAAFDPGGEAGLATPVAGTGLALRRAVAVLTAAFVVLAIGTLALPGLGSAPLGWVTPALALAVGSLAIGTWVRVEIAVACLAGAWVIAVGTLRYIDGPGHPFADTAVFSAAGQGVALALAVLAAVVLVTRADRYTTLEVRT